MIEHVADTLAFLAECHRVLKPGGILRIHTCHYSSSNTWVPCHRWSYSVKAFNFYASNTYEGRENPQYSDFKFSRVVSRRIIFPTRGFFAFNRPVQWLVNSSYKMQCVYEATGFHALFPAQDLEVVLAK